jgi:hypothetical protein
MTAPISDRSGQHRYDVAAERYPITDTGPGTSWLYYSMVLLTIAGFLNAIGGIAAISDSHFFVHNTHYVFGSLKAYGWVITFIGVAQLLIALGIYSRNQLARWLGVLALSLNAIAMLLMLPAYPLWSLAIFSLDLIAIYGLIAYGQRPEPR